jgi:molecular chaperone GrpE
LDSAGASGKQFHKARAKQNPESYFQQPIKVQEMEKNGKDGQQPAEFQIIDKRHFLNLDTIDKMEAVEEKPRYPSYVEELMARTAETERRFEERKKQFNEEIERIKARLEVDLERRMGEEKQRLALPLLEVLDNLERAIEAAKRSGSVDHLLEGVEMTATLFRSKLQSLGIEAIPVLNETFDPSLEQAIALIPVENESQDGVVLDELLRGYKLGDQLLRAAQVRVGQLKKD